MSITNVENKDYRSVEREALAEMVYNLLMMSKDPLSKSQICESLRIKGKDKELLRQSLLLLESQEKVKMGARRCYRCLGKNPAQGETIPMEVIFIQDDLAPIVQPVEWVDYPHSPRPQYKLCRKEGKKRTANDQINRLEVGDRLLARIFSPDTAELIKPVARSDKDASPYIGVIYTQGSKGNAIEYLTRKSHSFIPENFLQSVSKAYSPGDVVTFIYDVSVRKIKILENLGDFNNPRLFSLISIYHHQIPFMFPEEAVALAEKGTVPPLGQRTDLRHIDLVTIDGEDARDFDDAVWAKADTDPSNIGGWRILVAIADVSHYVRPYDALDREARKRGNSVYFPDRVVPMLPEALSNDLCSLKPGVDRACLAIEMTLSREGGIQSHKVMRGLMRSRARLTYAQVQKAIDGEPDTITAHLMDDIIWPLYGAYTSLKKARDTRGALEIEQEERQVVFAPDGHIETIMPRPRYESCQLIEEFMIAANVAAAETLEKHGWPCVYRVHDKPDSVRVFNLSKTLQQLQLPDLPTLKSLDQQTPQYFNAIRQIVLTHSEAQPKERTVNELILRCQSQARYSPENIGHFGLGLQRYAHFTSPIRRYADLLVHRALIGALKLGDGGFHGPHVHLRHVCAHISKTERLAATAERETMDRYMAAYMKPYCGQEMEAVIVGVMHFGLFVMVPSSGAQGLIPIESLHDDYYVLDEQHHTLRGRRTKKAYQLGEVLMVKLRDVDLKKSTMQFSLSLPKKPAKSSGKPKKKHRKQRGFDHMG